MDKPPKTIDDVSISSVTYGVLLGGVVGYHIPALIETFRNTSPRVSLAEAFNPKLLATVAISSLVLATVGAWANRTRLEAKKETHVSPSF